VAFHIGKELLNGRHLKRVRGKEENFQPRPLEKAHLRLSLVKGRIVEDEHGTFPPVGYPFVKFCDKLDHEKLERGGGVLSFVYRVEYTAFRGYCSNH
jgi:hypothetical protein